MTPHELLELNSEILRNKEMDYYKYHTFLNHLNELFERYHNTSGEVKEVVLLFTKEVIHRFVETYGVKQLPKSVRDAAQEIIIQKEWNFN